MKKAFPLRSLLGISQQDMAQLLGISRSQWSMFELGQRDLPTAAKLLLAEVTHAISHTESVKKNRGTDPQQAEMERYLIKLLCQNELWRLSALRKLDAARQKYEANLAVQQLAALLTGNQRQDLSPSKALLSKLKAKATASRKEQGCMALFQCEIRLNLLAAERKELEALQKQYAGKSAKVE